MTEPLLVGKFSTGITAFVYNSSPAHLGSPADVWKIFHTLTQCCIVIQIKRPVV